MDGWTTKAMLGLLASVGLLAACDTGDGKDLMPVDPADTTSSTVSLDSIGGSAVTLPSVSDAADAPLPSTPPTSIFEIAAPWLDGAPIDSRYACDGLDIAPAVSWGTPPLGTAEIAIVMVDESAVSNDMAFVHWVVAGIQPSEITLVEGDVPEGAVQAINFFGDVGYGGPCPPLDDAPHNYKLTVYALNQPLGLADRTPATEFLDTIENVTIGSTDLTGTFQR